MVPDADHPTRTITLALTLTLWGDQCLDAVACEGSRLIRPKGDAVDGGCTFQNSHTRGVRGVQTYTSTVCTIVSRSWRALAYNMHTGISYQVAGT